MAGNANAEAKKSDMQFRIVVALLILIIVGVYAPLPQKFWRLILADFVV